MTSCPYKIMKGRRRNIITKDRAMTMITALTPSQIQDNTVNYTTEKNHWNILPKKRRIKAYHYC